MAGILRRAAAPPAAPASQLRFDDGRLLVDRAAGRVWVRGEEVHLSATEYRLLLYLAEHAGHLLNPVQILAAVWGAEYRGEVEYVKSYVRTLRAKLEEDPRRPRYIVSRRGLGYMLERRHTPR